ncbi:hypothetical protein [Pseudomonas amygdali]|uniref:hypothetical protein n=1 Tax=Pseudomonas amygdali TaxID=47877 RepID=UPI001C58BFAE|nr:hypothetical protein [Pseudomonas amygdali]QXW43023.1 hypothetical protein KXJ79_14950 [Pseudomonas amygdali]
MKWGMLPGDERDLLFWVLCFVVEYYSNVDLNKFLKAFLTSGNGLAGDPGWEFECLRDTDGNECYCFSADFNFSGIEPVTRCYEAKVVREALKESLLAFADKEPDKADEVVGLIIKYRL